MTGLADVRILALILGASFATACASSGALAGPAPFPASATAARPLTPGDESPAAVDAVVSSALSLRGTPYRFGGATPSSGFDCSGFVAYVMAQHAAHMPRSVAEQFASGHAVARDQLRAGDLVFFSTIGPGATHVGIVTAPDRAEFVHAPSDGGSVRTERFDSVYWQSRYVGARRVL